MDSTVTQHAANVLEFVSGSGIRVSGDQLDLSTVIAGSWRRCALDYSLDPARHYAPTVVDAGTMAERRARHADLVHIASAEIDWLYEYIAESGYALVLTDASGIILYEKTDKTLRDTFRSAGLMVGADWSERREGTNGIGTCIAENRPIAVHREEHFRACHIGLTCSGFPIRDPAGTLVAVLDASTLNAQNTREGLAHTMALLNLSARLIEKCLFLRHFQRSVVFRFHARPEFVNLQHDGAIALAHDATVIAVDEVALRLLRAQNRADLIGRRIDEIFDVRAEELIDPARRDPTALRPVRDAMLGRRFFASLDHGTGTHMSTTSVAAKPERVLQLARPANRKSSLTLEELAGEDPQMLRNVRSAHRIAMSRVPVMIQGPTGAGKEMFAKALHAASDRAAHQFVALNCAAIPEALIESELFGYRSGAFTGARKEGMKGKILQSSGGTLFLDEIGDMPLSLQGKLLRFLEDKTFRRLGGTRDISVDVRIVAATNKDLKQGVKDGRFRNDLYYRLNVIPIPIPPLSQRKEDIADLVRHFVATYSEEFKKSVTGFDAEAERALHAYPWPGNIRELKNTIERAILLAEKPTLTLEDLPFEIREGSASQGARPTSFVLPREGVDLDDVHKDLLLQALERVRFNKTAAGKLLGLNRDQVRYWMRKYRIPEKAAAESAP